MNKNLKEFNDFTKQAVDVVGDGLMIGAYVKLLRLLKKNKIGVSTFILIISAYNMSSSKTRNNVINTIVERYRKTILKTYPEETRKENKMGFDIQ